MGVLQRFEKRLEGLVEGAFAKVFKGVVHPVEIAGAMQREANAHKSILGAGRTLVPNRYVIDLSPSDHDRLEAFAERLAQELAQTQAEYIGEQEWTVYGDVIVEIERGDGLDTGMFRVVSEVFTGSLDDEPMPPIATPEPVPDSQNPMGSRVTALLLSPDGRSHTLTVGSTVLGRGEGSQIRIPDTGISRRHARLDFDGSRVVVTDLGSTNGTGVNGSRINAATLQSGDVIQVGSTTLTLRLEG